MKKEKKTVSQIVREEPLYPKGDVFESPMSVVFFSEAEEQYTAPKIEDGVIIN